jgi:probable phosphoglycerate mutase
MNRVQGWSDTPLTPEGIETAQFLGKGLKDVRFDYVISSDLTRAIQTARLVMAENTADSAPEFMQSDMLRELCFGSFEGDLDPNMIAAVCAEGGYENFEAIAEAVGPAQNGVVTADLVKKLDTSGMAEDGETVKNRMQTKLRQIAEEQEARGGGTVLLVSHGVSITIMLSDLDPSFQDHVVRLTNAAVCKVVYKDGGFKIISFNDTSYIEKGRA